MATTTSAFLSSSPLVPMVVGIAGLSIITLIDKRDQDNKEWTISSWDFTKHIMPLLAIGVLAAGMGKGPALALLLAGLSLSLPNMLVIRGVTGTQKMLVYILLVVVIATISGLIYGVI